MKNEQITAWITKYALTSGIQKVSGTVHHDTNNTLLSYPGNHRSVIHYVWHKAWHRTPEAALARAEEMRKKKIAGLKKSIAKLEVIKFSAEE